MQRDHDLRREDPGHSEARSGAVGESPDRTSQGEGSLRLRMDSEQPSRAAERRAPGRASGNHRSRRKRRTDATLARRLQRRSDHEALEHGDGARGAQGIRRSRDGPARPSPRRYVQRAERPRREEGAKHTGGKPTQCAARATTAKRAQEEGTRTRTGLSIGRRSGRAPPG